jgi:signal transduction histidine kinase
MLKDGFAGKVNPEQYELLTRAYESNERQLTIVDDLLYVAQIDTGKAILRPSRTDLISLINSVISDQKSVIKSKQQKIVFAPPVGKFFMQVDPQYLRMIFENILSNASKYSYEKKTINIKIHSTKNNVEVSISDNGVGIKDEDYSKLFKKFSRISNPLTRRTSGSGIGLYLAHQLTLLHGGELRVESVIGRGSSFTVDLPRNALNHKL